MSLIFGILLAVVLGLFFWFWVTTTTVTGSSSGPVVTVVSIGLSPAATPTAAP